MIKASPQNVTDIYDHHPLVKAAVSDPGVPYTDDAPGFPELNRNAIRAGRMRAYRPAGAFDVRWINRVQHVIFMGVPIEPWNPDDGIPFVDVYRTLHPKQCPAGTPEFIVKALRRRLKMLQREAEKKAKKRTD